MGDGKYLSPDADRSKRNKYRLHSVLVHSGGTHGGHYYAYSRPDGVNWLKFEDEQVRRSWWMVMPESGSAVSAVALAAPVCHRRC